MTYNYQIANAFLVDRQWIYKNKKKALQDHLSRLISFKNFSKTTDFAVCHKE